VPPCEPVSCSGAVFLSITAVRSLPFLSFSLFC
jgi:hypothetical protein